MHVLQRGTRNIARKSLREPVGPSRREDRAQNSSWSAPGSIFKGSGGLLGGFWVSLGRSWASLGRSWAPLGRVLGASWALLGVSWALAGASWVHLASPGGSGALPGRVLEPPEAPFSSLQGVGSTLCIARAVPGRFRSICFIFLGCLYTQCTNCCRKPVHAFTYNVFRSIRCGGLCAAHGIEPEALPNLIFNNFLLLQI